jgi:hypothetical protein
MRRVLAALTACAVGLADTIPVPVFAQQAVAAAPAVASAPAATIDPIVLATFRAYPDGGQALTDRIRVLVLQNNYLAGDVARAIKANGLLVPTQRTAAEQGLAEALSRLGVTAQAAGGGTGLTGEQWTAILTVLSVGGGMLGFGIYEISKKNNPVTTQVSPN